MDVTFEPSAARGAALDRRMRARLADSLDYVFAQLGEDLGIDSGTAARTTESIRNQPQSPHRFGAYYDLVLTVDDEDLDEARRLARELIALEPAAGLRIASIEERPEEQVERERRLFLSDPAMAAQPDAELLESTHKRIADAFDLLERGFPEMAAEIRALLREIVIAAGPTEPNVMTFDGSSAYMLWGATLLNARGQTNVLDTAQALAHESGHNLLFGYCANGPLIENEDDELFESPLRIDPRPMDGIVHATYVIARMHQTVERLLASGVLTPEQTEAALADLDLHSRKFAEGDGVIRGGGRLTPLGEEIIASARDHMQSAPTAHPQPAIPA